MEAFGTLKCFRATSSCLLISNWYFGLYGYLAYKKNDRYLVGNILDWVMHSFPLIQSLRIWYYVWIVKDLQPVWVMILPVFFFGTIKVNHCILFFIIPCSISFALHTFPVPVTYGYEMKSMTCLHFFVIARTLCNLADFLWIHYWLPS